MSDLLDESIKQHVRTAQIINTIRLSRFFLVSILIITLYVYALYQFFFTKSSFYLNLWFIVTVLFISLSLLITNIYFKPRNFTLQQAHRWLQLQCVGTGGAIAVGISLIYYYLPQYNANFSPVQGLILSTLLLIASQAAALTFLTQRLRYFCLTFFPAILPYLIFQLIWIEHSDYLFHLAITFLLIITLLYANITSRIHHRLSVLHSKNNQLMKNAKQQMLWTDQLCQQLKTEINKSKNIESQLQLNNQLLEQKVKERTFDIAKMNADLENQQQSLILAHEIAGLRSWDWNIKDRKILLTDSKHQKTLKPSKQHHHQLKNIIHPEDIDQFKFAMKQHLRGLTPLYQATYRIQQHSGKWKWVHDIGTVIWRNPTNQKPLRMVGIRRDIDQERSDQERLKLAASVLKQAAEGIFILDEHLCYIDINPFYQQLTGCSEEQLIGEKLFTVVGNNTSEQKYNHAAILHQLRETGEFEGELNEKFHSRKELIVWMHINAITDEENRVTHYIGIVADLTERKRQQQRLSYLENYDPLTDLPNRFYYNYQLHQYLVSQKDSTNQLAIIRLNIDRFRALNEFLSNTGGDELLRQVAQRLRLCNIEALMVAHLNGDDFAIVYEISHIRSSIQPYCKAMMQAFSLPFNILGQDHIITISMGISFYPGNGRQLDYLNNCAEQALSEAKGLGGNTFSSYTPKKNILIEQGVYLERDLRQAIQNNELVVYYQPKINFSDQNIYGFEALVRWNHPSKGIIPPNLFIPFAEQTSLISEIGKIVIQQTAKQIRYWNDLGFNNICVSVNVVAQQLQRGELLDDLDDAIETYKISGSSLELEITESSLLENSDTLKKLLHEIKKRKINISLDDFGTGYSSLSYLADFPIDILKIDRSFISKISQSKQKAIVHAMIAMGKAMNLVVVAEGIETEEQLLCLQDLKCDIAQGFLFSKPLPGNEATLFLEQHQLITY